MATWTGWPTKHEIGLYYRNVPFDYGSDTKPIDLADAIMLRWPMAQRTVEMRLRATELEDGWLDWEGQTLERAEENIRHDLSHDGYQVSIKRIAGEFAPCDIDMIWKLVVKPI